MANHEIGNPYGVQNVGTDNRSGAVDYDNADTISTLRTRLTAISATAYSASNLDKMTYNDMIYALRVHDFAADVK